MKATSDIVNIISTGCPVIVDASKPNDEMVRLVKAAVAAGTILTIRKAGNKDMQDLQALIRLGPKNIVFDFTD